MKLSFVVPAYNAEEYISKCLDSLLAQSLDVSEYEILVINDGSTDATLNIALKYIEKYTNIKLINQNNKGLAETRNVGIKNSRGQYIWFIDSDDYIVENCAANILSFVVEKNLDMFLVAPSANVTENFQKDWNEKFPPVVVKGSSLLKDDKVDVGAWAYLFKKSFIELNNLRFLSGSLFEDSEFTPRALFYASNVGLIDFSVYYYIQHGKSIMHTFSSNRLRHYINVAKAMDQFRKENSGNLVVQKYFSSAIVGMVLSGFNKIALHGLSSRYLIDYVDECRSSGLIPLKQVEAGLARLIAINFATTFPSLYVNFLRSKNIFLRSSIR